MAHITLNIVADDEHDLARVLARLGAPYLTLFAGQEVEHPIVESAGMAAEPAPEPAKARGRPRKNAAPPPEALKNEPEPEPAPPPASPPPTPPADVPIMELVDCIARAYRLDPEIKARAVELRAELGLELLSQATDLHRPGLMAFIEKHNLPLI